MAENETKGLPDAPAHWKLVPMVPANYRAIAPLEEPKRPGSTEWPDQGDTRWELEPHPAWAGEAPLRKRGRT